MSHNPQASEPFKLPQQTPPLTDNVHKLLENCRRRAREHGVTQFTGNADGLFGNELAVALAADGKAVAPEMNPDQYAEDMVKNYGQWLAEQSLGFEWRRRLYDTLRPHVKSQTLGKFFSSMVPEDGIVRHDFIAAGRRLRALSQYGIRAVLYPEQLDISEGFKGVCEQLDMFQPGLSGELKEKFPLS